MRISWNWLKEILPLQMDVAAAASLLTDIGLEVEGTENYESITGSLKGLITAEVMAVAPHPDADRLQVCQVSCGETDLLQIVCGAPNVAKGQKVILAQVGTTLHPTAGEPFTIRKAKIRGVESEGMLCAADEIGLGEDHSGLYILPSDTAVGIAVTDVIPVYQDVMIDIGLTANHADAYSHLGTARELSTGLSVRRLEEVAPIFPAVATLPEGKCPIEVEVQHLTACPRYSAICLSHIEVKPSPDWMQSRLKALGVRPVNNVVDITNYVLHELGQPLHAFDADQIEGKKIQVRNVAAGTAFTTLDDKNHTLNGEELMICDAVKPLCIGGVMGGKNSGVQAGTQNLFLESAFFQGAGIRRTETRLGIKTDASSRFAKGTDPEITIQALARAVYLLQTYAGAQIEGGLIDIYPEMIKPFTLDFRLDRLERMAGAPLPAEAVEKTAFGLGIEFQKTEPGVWKMQIPVRKNDVYREADMAEEVLRMYGYNMIGLPEQVRTPFTLSPKPDMEQMRRDASLFLSARGYYEIFTNSIGKSKYIDKFMPEAAEQVVRLLNSLNAELDSLRPVTLFSGMEVIQHNQNRKRPDLRLYEFGKIFSRRGDSYTEEAVLSLFLTGRASEENWKAGKESVDFFDLKADITRLASHWLVPFETTVYEQHPLLEQAVALVHEKEVLGVFGQIKSEIAAAFDVRQSVYYAEICWLKWLAYRQTNRTYQAVSRYPEVRRDLSLLLEPDVSYDTLEKAVVQAGGQLLQQITLFDVYEGPRLEGKKSYAIGMLFRDDQKTLTDVEIDQQMKRIIETLEKDCGAVIRQS